MSPAPAIRAARSNGGFTLIEMVISIGLLSVVVGALVGVMVSLEKDYDRQRNVNRSQETLRAAETAITTVLRSAKADPFETGGASLDPDPLDHAAFDNLRVVSDFNPADGDFEDPLEDVAFWLAGDTLKVRWEAGGSALPLAWPVTELAFDYYDSGGNVLPDEAQVVDATRVRVSLAADKGPRATALDELSSWVYLRN